MAFVFAFLCSNYFVQKGATAALTVVAALLHATAAFRSATVVRGALVRWQKLVLRIPPLSHPLHLHAAVALPLLQNKNYPRNEKQ